MNREEYLKMRNELLEAAQKAIEAGDSETFEAKSKEVEELDARFEKSAQQQADLNALKGAVKPPMQMANVDGISLLDRENGEDKEYRKAFMNYVMKGGKIPMQNTDATTVTDNVGAVIPQTVLNRIIEKLESNGNILSRVTRTHYKGGVSIPTSEAKPTASWVAERGDVDSFAKTTGSVSFTYHKLKVKVAISLVVDNVTMEVFERTLADNIAEAMIRALEGAIINGTGATYHQPVGILTETAVEGQTVAITGDVTYSDLLSIEAALPSAYEAGAVYVMHKKIFFTKILSIVDDNGQPIARVDSGFDGKPRYSILGREVVLTDHMPYTISSTAAKLIALVDLKQYMINTNMNVTVSTYTDEDTDDKVTKAIMLADGKLIDKNGLVFVTIKNS
jgi:HK97 family phage major capsid protein